MANHEIEPGIAQIDDRPAHRVDAFPEGCLEAVTTASRRELQYSICTCVTRPSQYAEMVTSFRSAGFTSEDCEFLYVDNSDGNSLNAFAAYNLFLRIARGRYVILCHQDIVLRDDRSDLDRLIAAAYEFDPAWGLLGNAGGASLGRLSIRITDAWGENTRRGGPFPARVRSLDENFMIARAAANLALSGDLSGFHLYGTDISLVADVLGYHCYVIDFHVWHKGSGVVDASFWDLRAAMIAKYRRAFRARAITTTCTNLVLLPSRIGGQIANTGVAGAVMRHILRAARRGRKGWMIAESWIHLSLRCGRVAGDSAKRQPAQKTSKHLGET